VVEAAAGGYLGAAGGAGRSADLVDTAGSAALFLVGSGALGLEAGLEAGFDATLAGDAVFFATGLTGAFDTVERLDADFCAGFCADFLATAGLTGVFATACFTGVFFATPFFGALFPLAGLAAGFDAGLAATFFAVATVGFAFFTVAGLRAAAAFAAGLAAAAGRLAAAGFATGLALLPLPAVALGLPTTLVGALSFFTLAAVELRVVFAIFLHRFWPWRPGVIAHVPYTGKHDSGILVALNSPARRGYVCLDSIDTVVAPLLQALAQPVAWTALPFSPQLLRLCTYRGDALRPVAWKLVDRLAAVALPAALHGRRGSSARAFPPSPLPTTRPHSRYRLTAGKPATTGSTAA
jgi:hypothetical protein